MLVRLFMVILLGLGLAGSVVAGEHQPGPQFQPVDLAPVRHAQASLTLIAPDGSRKTFSPEELEKIGSYRLTTRTPWRETPATFEGPLLADVLAIGGLADLDAVEVTAENDYTVTIEREVWTSVPILVATRVNGQPHNRRERGPIQFVMDMNQYRSSPVAAERHWVWMAATIKPAQ